MRRRGTEELDSKRVGRGCGIGQLDNNRQRFNKKIQFACVGVYAVLRYLGESAPMRPYLHARVRCTRHAVLQRAVHDAGWHTCPRIASEWRAVDNAVDTRCRACPPKLSTFLILLHLYNSLFHITFSLRLCLGLLPPFACRTRLRAHHRVHLRRLDPGRVCVRGGGRGRCGTSDPSRARPQTRTGWA